jgi:hypothetical protein
MTDEAASENPETAGENPETAGENPETAGENPETAGENPETAGENPETAGENPEARSEKAADALADVVVAADMIEPAGPALSAALMGREASGEPKGDGTAASKPTARFLTTTIVLVTLVGALAGLLLNRASAESSDESDVAQELSLRASAAETSAYQQAESDYAQYLSLQSLKAQAAQEMLEATYEQVGTPAWAALYKVTSQQATQTAASVATDLQPNLANGDPDPNFPYDFLAKRAFAGQYLAAQSDGYNDASDTWSRLVDWYAAVLTVIAVALFLFGSAYVLHGRNRILFTLLGGLLVATGAAWGAAVTAGKEPGTPSTAAARDYANGVTAMNEAVGHAGFQTAITDFTDAIGLRPDYALAYSERAAAEALRGSETIGAGFISVVAPHWERLAAGDELRAYQLGDHDAGQLLDVGWSYYTVWMTGGGVGRPPAAAVGFFQKAAQLDPSNPITLLDLGIADLANGRYHQAVQAYAAAVTHMLYTCSDAGNLATCTSPQPATSHELQQAWLGGGLQSLDDLAQSKAGQDSAGLRSTIAKMEGVLAGSMAAGKVLSGPDAGAIKVPGLTGFVDPSYLGLQVPLPSGVSADKMRTMPLTVLWYERPLGSKLWVAITATACWGHGQQYCGAYYRSIKAFQFVTRFLAANNACFTDLEYRAVMYVGGTLAGSLTLGPQDDAISTNLAPALSEDMNVGTCVPSTWHRQPLPELTLPVYGTSATVSGSLSSSELSYSSADHTRGVYLFRLYPPRTSLNGAAINMQDLVQEGEDYAIDVLKGRGLPADIAASGPPRPYTLWGPLVTGMTATFYSSRSSHTEALVGAAVVGPDTLTRPADQDRWIAADVTSDYAVVVTVVYAPEADQAFWSGQHALGIQIFSSWTMLAYG